MTIEISVIVAAYNSQDYIGRCLRSLIDQSISKDKYEIVIVNDGSEDFTDYALSLFKNPSDSLIKVIKNERNLGLPASLNKGIELSKGNLIVRVDSDDYVNRNFLAALRLYLDVYKDISAVACDYILVDKFENILEVISSKDHPIACGIMFRKDKLIDIGLYNKSFKFNEEKELMMRFQKKFKLHNLNLPLYRYRKHENNMTNNLDEMEKYEILLRETYKN